MEWQPVTEMPEREGWYLVYLNNTLLGASSKQMSIRLYATYAKADDRWCIHKWDKVTHWMPLPEPPGKEG